MSRAPGRPQLHTNRSDAPIPTSLNIATVSFSSFPRSPNEIPPSPGHAPQRGSSHAAPEHLDKSFTCSLSHHSPDIRPTAGGNKKGVVTLPSAHGVSKENKRLGKLAHALRSITGKCAMRHWYVPFIRRSTKTPRLDAMHESKRDRRRCMHLRTPGLEIDLPESPSESYSWFLAPVPVPSFEFDVFCKTVFSRF